MNLLQKHKRLVTRVQQELDLSDYQMLWLSFAKGLLIGAIFL